MRISRRDFVKSATASGIALSITPLAIAAEPSFAARETLPGRRGWNPAATGPGRIDGVANVTGAKLYASDFRAVDLPGWPAKTSHAMLIRAQDATHVYTGLDLSPLSGALKPSVVVTAADLARAGIRVPEFYAGDLLCPAGKTPLYLGQPVALLIFEDFDAFDRARLALRDAAIVKFGVETGPVKMPNYGQFRFTRVAGPTPDAPDVYSPVKNGWVSPGVFDNTGRAPAPNRASLCRRRELWRKDLRGARSQQSGTVGARPRIRDAVRRPDVSRAGKRNCLVRRAPQEPRARRRHAIALRGRGIGGLSARQRAGGFQAGPHQRKFCLLRRGIWRTRPHAIPALRRAGGGVLPQPSGAARQQPLRAVSIGNQAARLQDAHAHRRRSGDRQDGRICRRPCIGWRRPRQFFGHRRERERQRRAWRLLRPESRCDDVCVPFARRDCGLDARLRNLADDDRARSVGR